MKLIIIGYYVRSGRVIQMKSEREKMREDIKKRIDKVDKEAVNDSQRMAKKLKNLHSSIGQELKKLSE